MLKRCELWHCAPSPHVPKAMTTHQSCSIKPNRLKTRWQHPHTDALLGQALITRLACLSFGLCLRLAWALLNRMARIA